ncbi:MAG: restriction endonuclease subunit S [Firmicutes bacterium]|nr:restriction endonuclease subunit S [Bacillota bacterium]
MAREMKDSGIEWIGDIPKNWTVLKNKYIFKISSGESINKEELDNNGNYPVYGGGEQLGFYDKYNVLPNSILIGRVGARCGCITYVHKHCWATDNALIASTEKNNKYLLYALDTSNLNRLNESNAQPLITATKVLNVSIPYPNVLEQQQIASFLDTECSRIDAVIEQTRASIEEYKKLKQAVITQAVTKGIRPNRPMKDSGIEWIGKIPEDWNVIKFKYIASVKSNLVHPTEYQDYMQIAPDNIEKGSAKLLECKTVGEVGVESDNHLFYKGQIIYSKIRPILNKVIIAPFDGLCSADMYPIETTINKYFLLYMMLSDRFLTQVKLVTENRVKMPKINQDELGQILIYLPLSNEQQEIAIYLDDKCNEIDMLISKKEQLLLELTDYKKSLIYEYVTGKKEVP